MSSDSASRIDRHMLEALVCPVTQGRLNYDAAAQELIRAPRIWRSRSAMASRSCWLLRRASSIRPKLICDAVRGRLVLGCRETSGVRR